MQNLLIVLTLLLNQTYTLQFYIVVEFVRDDSGLTCDRRQRNFSVFEKVAGCLTVTLAESALH